jgi:hypothetical protein
MNPDPCAGALHRLTKLGAITPCRWRCIVCERQFVHAPTSVRVHDEDPDPNRPPPTLFVAISTSVMLGRHHIATAISKTMAKRIANALNRHKPNDEGV